MELEIREQLSILAALQKAETEASRLEASLAGVEKKMSTLNVRID